MQYAVVLYFDEETDGEIYALSEAVAREKISTGFLDWRVRPHLSLACFHDVDETSCAEKLKQFASSHKKMPAYIGSVGMFPDTKTIFVSPVMYKELYAFQRDLHECMKGFDTKGFEWYLPDRWSPHCTVALTKEDGEDAFFRASEVVLHKFKKLCGTFVSVGLIKVVSPVEEIFTAELCD